MISESHEKLIEKVIVRHFGKKPEFIRRMTTGICNEVYLVSLGSKEVIARLKAEDRWLLGSHYYIPKFKKLGITVPDILAEDYSKKFIPYAYQIQSKIEGKDLGDVIETLTEVQLRVLAKEIVGIINKFNTIPAIGGFGPVWGEQSALCDSWAERMRLWASGSEERGRKTGVMDDEMQSLLRMIDAKYRPYFDSVKAVTYYDDICSKNVMIADGKFNGLVDLDSLTQGDSLEAIGRIKLSWHGKSYGKIYSDAIIAELGLNEKQEEIVTMYALFDGISFACENGIKFNENTSGVVDQAKAVGDKQRIKALATELELC